MKNLTLVIPAKNEEISLPRVLEEIKKVLDSTQKSEFESKLMANYQSQFQWFLGAAFLLLFIDLFFLERKTKWIQDLNLFNEKDKNK